MIKLKIQNNKLIGFYSVFVSAEQIRTYYNL